MTADLFASDWLALREPADHTARDRALTSRAVAALGDRPGRSPGGPRIVDLGAGSGSNMAFLAPRLPPEQHWRLIDIDDGLLARAMARAARAGVPAEAITADLGESLTADLIADADLLTATAFLDLVSEDWIEHSTAVLAANPLPVLITLSVDGRVDWHPRHPLDAAMAAGFAADQARDKGLGAALGAAAPEVLARSLRAVGWQVLTARADWRLTGRQRALQREYLRGYAEAAGTAVPHLDARRWLRARTRTLQAGRLGMRVGHVDLLALPPGIGSGV